MIHVRRYVPADLDRVLPMAKAFHAESPRFRDKTFDDATVANMLAAAMASLDWLAVIAENGDGELTGFGLVAVQPFYFSTELQLVDLAIYVTPTARGARSFVRLISYIEDWARVMGAVEANLGITTGINDELALRSFQKLGFERTGVQVTKRLTN